MSVGTQIRIVFLLSMAIAASALLCGCGSPGGASAIPAAHPAAAEPAKLPEASSLVYSVSTSLTELLVRINDKLSQDRSLSRESRDVLIRLREDLIADIEFAMPFVSPEIDHPDQIRVLRYLIHQQRKHLNTMASI